MKTIRVSTGYQPHRCQQEIQHKLKRFNVLVCHRRFGKTVAAINILIDAAMYMDTIRSDGRFGYVAPFMNQARAIAWDYIKQYTNAIPGIKYREQTAEVVFPNGTKIRLFGADNAEAMRGLYFDGVVLDEVADMRPHVWSEIVRPALSDRLGWALFIGTPKGVNMFSELYFKAVNSPDWYAAMYRASETGLISESELAAARETMSESQYAQEFECDFNAAVENVLIPVSLAVKAASRHIAKAAVARSPKVLGVDVARYGSDRSCIFPRQGLVAYKPKVFNNIGNMDLADQCMMAYDKFEPDAMFIDAGRGEGVIDRLLQLGYPAIEVNFGGKPTDDHYANKRAEMWDTMHRWLEAGGVIPNDPDLKTDLCVPTYTYKNAANKFQLESKDDIKKRGMKSPDIGDGLALTFAMPVRPKNGYDSGWRSNSMVNVDYDPFNG